MAQKKALTSDQQTAFDRIRLARREMLGSGKVIEMKGDKEFILNLKVIENKQTFFNHLLICRKSLVSMEN